MTLQNTKIFKNPIAAKRARGSLYGMLVVVVSILVHLGFFHEPEPSAAALVSSGKLLARFGALDAAWSNTERVLKEDPEHIGGQLLQAYILEKKGDLDDAISCYQEALGDTTDPDVRRDIQLFVADLQRRQRNYDAAVNTLSVLERIQGISPGIHRMLGMVRWDQGDLPLALEAFRAMRQLDPGSSEAAACEARMQVEMGSYAEAAATLKTAPLKNSDHTRAVWRRLIRVCVETGNLDLAIESMSFCLKDDPATPNWLKKDEFWSQHAGDLRIEEVLK